MSCPIFTDPSLQKCLLFLPNGTTIGNETIDCQWSCGDLTDFCTSANRILDSQDPSKWPTQFRTYAKRCFILPVALLFNSLLFATLFSDQLRGSTFAFVRFIASAQFVQVVLIASNEATIFDSLPPDLPKLIKDSFDWLVYSLRLVVPTVSLFMTLDRFLAVCSPARYSKMNSRKFVFVSILISIFVGCLQLEPFLELKLTPQLIEGNKTKYRIDGNYLSERRIYFRFVAPLSLALKIVEAVSMSIFGLAICSGLRRRGRRVADIVGDASAEKEYRDMLVLCRFQLVDTVSMIVDVCFSCFVEFLTLSYFDLTQTGQSAGPTCSFTMTYQLLNMISRVLNFDYALDLFQSSGHAELFPIYLIFFAKFRLAFINVSKRGVDKCRHLLGGTTATTGLSMYGN